MNTLYHSNRCSKSRNALKLLKEKEISFQVRYYLDQALNKEELIALQSKLQVPLIEMVRTSENVYKELFGKDTPSDDALLEAIIKHPILLQRPIFEIGEKAVIARPTEKLLEII